MATRRCGCAKLSASSLGEGMAFEDEGCRIPHGAVRCFHGEIVGRQTKTHKHKTESQNVSARFLRGCRSSHFVLTQKIVDALERDTDFLWLCENGYIIIAPSWLDPEDVAKATGNMLEAMKVFSSTRMKKRKHINPWKVNDDLTIIQVSIQISEICDLNV